MSKKKDFYKIKVPKLDKKLNLDPNKNLADDLRDMLLSYKQVGPVHIKNQLQNVLEFLNTAGQKPTPVQQFVLKLVYGIPLDDTNRTIRIYDRFKENLLDTKTEVGFFNHLKSENRVNLPDYNYHASGDPNIWQIQLIWGRRGGKSAITGFILAYEIYKLLHYWSPHDFFGIIDTEEIRVMSVGPSKDQADTVRGYALSCIDGHPFFKPYVLGDTSGVITFKTQKQIDRKINEDKLRERPGLTLSTYAANERLVRGKGNIILVFDEIAHFLKTMGSVTGDKTIVDAASPSQARFHKDIGDGRGDLMFSKVFYISDPLDEVGVFYDEYKAAIKPGAEKTRLMVKLSTIVANPDAVTTEFLKKEYESRGEKSFRAAYEAEFTLGVTSFIEDLSWLGCFKDSRSFTPTSKRGVWYYGGLDLGFMRDRTAISIVHRTNIDSIVQDYLKYFDPEHFDNDQELYNAILEELEMLQRIYEPREMITDQYEGRGLVNACARFNMEMTLMHMTQFNHSAMAKLFRTLLRSSKFETSAKDGKLLREELVQLRKMERGQDVIRVEKTEGFYDDGFDATIRSIWAALVHEKNLNRGVEEAIFQNNLLNKSVGSIQSLNTPTGASSAFRANIRNRGMNRWGQRR